MPCPPAPRVACSGPVAGVVGALQAVEVVKELAGVGSSLSGKLLLYDAAVPSSRPYRPAPPVRPAQGSFCARRNG